MIPDSALPALRATCRTLQIIVLALATGVCVFAVIAVLNSQGQMTWEFPPAEVLDLIFLGFGVVTLIGSVIVPPFVMAPDVRESKSSPTSNRGETLALQAAATLQIRTIVSCALVEGGAFANLIAVFMHGYGPSLVMAAVLMSMIVVRLPIWSRYLERIEAQIRRIEENLNG
jgi:hypothetical protein